MHPDILVTVAEAVAGAESIAGFTEGQSNPVRLKVLGTHGGVAVLAGWFDHLPPDLVPAPLVPTGDLPSGSLAFLVGAGDFGRESVALPGAFFRMPLVRSLREKDRKPTRQVLGLKGVHCTGEDQGGVVCDSSLRLIGILRGRPSVHRVIPPLKAGSENSRERRRRQMQAIRVFLASRNFQTLLPARKVLDAVNRVLADREEKPAPPAPPSLGISCLETERGILVVRVYFGGPAFRAGMKKGDRLTHWEGRAVYKISTLKELAREGLPPEGRLELGVDRAGRKMKLDLLFPGKSEERGGER
jgi:hypothetical protein